MFDMEERDYIGIFSNFGNSKPMGASMVLLGWHVDTFETSESGGWNDEQIFGLQLLYTEHSNMEGLETTMTQFSRAWPLKALHSASLRELVPAHQQRQTDHQERERSDKTI